ncbi:RND family efflux transporter MFP subunit [Bradymonas sediminis]|nr:RND family efflux transporter MFP subunit [Bradymonas sediminis]
MKWPDLGGRARLEAIILTALWLCLAGCAREGPDASQQDVADAPLLLAAADVTQVRRGRVAAGPRISGSTRLEQTSSVRAELGGEVTEVDVERGEPVTAGQVLARIKKDAVGANVESARVALRSSKQQLNVARAELKRTQHLIDQGAFAPNRIDIPKNQVSAARAQVGQAEAALVAAEQSLGDATVRAPMNGVVSERAVDAGDVVSIGNLLFTVVDPSSVQFEATAPAESAETLKVGTPVEFRVRGYREREFRGVIARVDPVAQAQTRQIPIIVDISEDDKNQQLVAGLFAEGRVIAEARRGLFVSLDAVDRSEKNPTALVLRDGQTQRVYLEPGLVDQVNNTIEILAGVEEGEYILVGSAARDLKPGTPVELKIDAAGASTPSSDAPSEKLSPNIGGGPADDGP